MLQVRTPLKMALTGAVALGGCENFLGIPVPQITPGRTPIAAVASPSPSMTTTPSALPIPVLSPQAVRSQILEDFGGSVYQPLFTSRLINDGIGIFAGATSVSSFGARRWGRSYTDNQVNLAREAAVSLSRQSDPMRALVVLRHNYPGQWLGDFSWRRNLVRKGFEEVFLREALLEKDPTVWRPAGLSVAVQQPPGATVDLVDVTLAKSGQLVRYHRTGAHPSERIMPFADVFRGVGGEPVEVVVRTTSAPVQVFVHLGGNRRQTLVRHSDNRDGTTFSGTISFPAVVGIGQLGIDAIATQTLEIPGALYDACIWGLPIGDPRGVELMALHELPGFEL